MTRTLLTVPSPGPLAQRDPQQQHQRADDHRPLPDAQAEVPGQALVQHVPRT